MQFRLTYDGELYSSQPDDTGYKGDRRANHKHEIRRKFHPQLKRLWEITPFLRNGAGSGPGILMDDSGDMPDYSISALSHAHSHYGWNFVPLVTRQLKLICGLDILFLRPDFPGEVVSGDVDNRLKTLFDALQIPDAGQKYSDRSQNDDDKPFFCLLENDALITKISVETDQLLQAVDGKYKKEAVRLIITVTIRPYEVHLGNLPFA